MLTVNIPVLRVGIHGGNTPPGMQQCLLLQRNLIHSGMTGARSWSCSSVSGRRWRWL
jgi:hypothetical protein